MRRASTVMKLLCAIVPIVLVSGCGGFGGSSSGTAAAPSKEDQALTASQNALQEAKAARAAAEAALQDARANRAKMDELLAAVRALQSPE